MSNPLNITTASFGGLREVATSPLWQWDYGQILKITGLDLPQAFEVHFSNSRKSGETVTQIGTDSQVVIPDMYLTSGADIYAFIFLHDGLTDGETEYVIKIPVRERPEPSDIEPTPEQQDVITEAIAALNDAVTQTGEDVISADASAQAAAESATNAQTAAQSAQGSATATSASATTASNAAATATQKASEAATSAASAASAKTAAETAETNAQAAQTASESAQASAESAAQTATAKASEAAASAASVGEAAQTATAKAAEASASATSASGSATAAAGSATTASTKASEAAQSEADTVIAKNAAEAAQSAAETAQGKAEDAQEAAETTAQSISASAAQIATNTADITQLKSEVSALPTDGVVANSKQLLSENGTDNTEPYMFRAVPVNADRAELDAVVGSTVVWNQLVNFTLIPTVSKGITYSSVDGKSVTFNGTATSLENRTGWFGISEMYVNTKIDHKFLFIPKIISGSFDDGAITYSLFGSTPRDFNTPVIGEVGETQINQRIGTNVTRGTVANNFTVTFICIDLTAMFGSTIADYIYQLDQSTAGAGVAFFRKLFPKDYYPYDAGTLKSVEGVSEKVTRDADNNVLGTYPLDSTLTLRGIPKLADGKLSYDGDRYLPDGTVTRRYGIVDLGTLTWTRNTGNTNPVFYTDGIKNYAVTAIHSEMYAICPLYTQVFGNVSLVSFAEDASNMSFAITTSGTKGRLGIRNDSYTDAATFKAAMSGVMLVYELATPTTEIADPYQSLQVCDPNGTEEFVTTGIVPVGHETRYPENLRAKIEGLPWDFSSLIAPTEKTTTASRNYTTGALLIMNNVLYKVTANIANGGTITPNTNVTATTLSEVISALQ